MVSLLDTVGFAWSEDLERYGSSSIATGRAPHSGEVKGDDQMKIGTLVLQVGGLALSYQSHTIKKVDAENTSKALERIDKQDNSVYKEKDLTFGTWNIKTLQNRSMNIHANITKTL